MAGKNSLTATNLATHHHFNCDLYLHNVYHRPQMPGLLRDISDLSKAQFQRGNEWEKSLFAWLELNHLLLTVPSEPLDPTVLLENILADGRDHFYIAGLNLRPPQEVFNERYRENGKNSVKFGLAKPDLVEVSRTQDGVLWRVIDAKTSAEIKTSHHVQIYFYSLCLTHILLPPFFQNDGSAGIWLPPKEGFGSYLPTFDGLKYVHMSSVSPPLDHFLFKKLPELLSLPAENVKWHYNPLCKGCPYEQDCKKNALIEGELGSLPNITLDDAQILRALLRLSSNVVHREASSQHISDIEDLHQVIADPTNLAKLATSHANTVKRSMRILALPKKGIHKSSPVIEASRTRSPQIKFERSLTFPRHEDVAVVMSLISDSASQDISVQRYTISVISAKPLPIPGSPLQGPGSELISTLARLIKTIMSVQLSFSPALTTQFYVWSPKEHSALQAHFIQAALTSSAHVDEIRICIGALAQGASLLQTTFQPILLAGAALNFLTNSKRTKTEHKALLKRMGLSTEGSTATLRERVDHEIRKLRTNAREGRAESGQLQRVVVLKREVERLIALPVPGYWDMPECASALLLPTDPPDNEELFRLFQLNITEALDGALARCNDTMHAIIRDIRARIAESGRNLLVNDAQILSSSFMDICRQEHLRKLFFVQQFELLTKLGELWHSRIEGCPDAPVLRYITAKCRSNGTEHVFQLISGTLDTPVADRTLSMYDKILVLDEARSDDLPVEVLFDDLAVSDLVFPLAKHTRSKWNAQHAIIQRELYVADVRDITVSQSRTEVVLQVWSCTETELIPGHDYRISPRLVDFNTPKALAVLLEMDLRCEAKAADSKCSTPEHYDIPVMQMILDPASFGTIPMAEEYIKSENTIQKLFRELRDLGNEQAGGLVLKSSQHQAVRKILSHRLSIIWGPPGTGKTYTITLSLLRLLEVQYRYGDMSLKTVFITAMTHAAIDACQKKLLHLVESYRSIGSLSTNWLDQISVEKVTQGSNHPAPSTSQHLVHVYAGTIYQLYHFTKRHAFQVDCVIIDEAGQLGLSSVALVLRALHPTGRIIIAGDSQQLAPILTAQYPRLKTRPLFGSVLDCLMDTPQTPLILQSNALANQSALLVPSIESSNTVQLIENFRLNPDLGDFVSTIYSRAFNSQKTPTRQLASSLKSIENDHRCYFGIQPDLLRDIGVFLVSLSKVMLQEPQTVLLPPGLEPSKGGATTKQSDVASLPQAISLALIKLNTRDEEAAFGDMEYEDRVRGEAAVAAALVTLLRACSPDEDVFVATPHRVQRTAVKAALARVTLEDELDLGLAELKVQSGGDTDFTTPWSKARQKVTVDTIERLQGSEAAFVICLFSLAKSPTSPDLGFLLDRRRLNVAISRAKTLCIVVTSQEVMCPGVSVLANEETAKGYAFLKAFEDRAWSYELGIAFDKFR